MADSHGINPQRSGNRNLICNVFKPAFYPSFWEFGGDLTGVF